MRCRIVGEMTKRCHARLLVAGAVLFLAALLSSSPLRAQLPTMSDVDRGGAAPATGPLPEWDVAVIKPHPVADTTMSWQLTANGLSLKGLPLEQMIGSAWDLKPYQIVGLTGWMKSSSFDLTAKVGSDAQAAYEKLSVAQRRQMLQQLLTERFHLKVHTESKVLPTYELLLDKNGSKLKPSTAIDAPSPEERKANPDKYRKGFMIMSPDMYEGTGVPVRSLASHLSNILGRPVTDNTGLTGLYDITLHFHSQDTAGDEDADSVFAAVRDQLGLRLSPGKGPVALLVVDAAQSADY